MRLLKKSLRRAKLIATLSFWVFLTASFAFQRSVVAQGDGLNVRQIPSPSYYNGVQFITSGNFSRAEAFYAQELRNAIRLGAARYIDSICYYAMLGEAQYRAGALKEALANYNAALVIAMEYPSWLGRVTYPTGVTTSLKPPAPWGVSRRNTPLGVFPKGATIVVGDKITEDRIKQGGALMEQKAIQIDPLEILRCTALAVRRRNEILGPLSPFDPTSQQLYDSFQKRSVAPNHWSVTLLDVIWGMVIAENDKIDSAINKLTQALVMAGSYDHPLTGAALFELGNLYLRTNRAREAAQCYYEASVSAFHYGDLLLVEEAIRNYSNVSKALGASVDNPVVETAYRWSKTLPNSQTLVASFGLELVEEFIERGKLNLATSGLDAVAKTMRSSSSRDLQSSCAADRWNYLNALLFYANGEIADGDVALAKVVEGAKLRSTWAIQLIDLDNRVKRGLSSSGDMTPRNAADLYELLLREPTALDWATKPADSLAIQMIAPTDAYERWFRILFERDLKDKAFEVAERIRRERFFRTQTYGGRLVSLRYILTADDALLAPSTRATKQTLLAEYPLFAETTQAAEAIINELAETPTVPTDSTIKSRQISLYAKLAEISDQQEALLRYIAAGRSRIPYVFPPVYSVADVQKRLPEDTAILAFIDADGETFGFMVGKENLDAWRVGSTAKLGVAVSAFLKTIGNLEGTRQVEASALAEAHWKSQGARLREIVLGAQDVDADRFNIVFSKLAVVPDSVLWYLPFEALCLPAVASTIEDVDAEPSDDATTETDESVVIEGAELAQDDENAASDNADEEEDDLDSAYRATDEEIAEVENNIEEIVEEEEEEEETTLAEDEAKDEGDETLPEQPTKRKSRSARQREALEEYEASLIPMIQASELTIRYSAAASLALPNALGRNAFVETTIAGGTSYPKEPFERVESAVQRFESAVSKTEAFRLGSFDVPGAVYASRLKRLVVLEEINGETWNWNPVVPGKTRAGNKATDWIASPWGAPRLYVAPALRTSAEDALKNGGDGSELFLPILAMQASGADAMLLSRWRTGGRSAYDLALDFVKNYEKEPTANAWKHAALKLMKRDVVVEEEPRLRKLGRNESIPKYDSPFWWAGYMIIDSGEAVQASELELLDEENAKKAAEENAMLDGKLTTDDEQEETPNGENPASQKTDEQNDPDAVSPKIIPGKKNDPDAQDENDPLNLEPKSLDDEELAAQDEAGDDFFFNEEDELEPDSEPKDEGKNASEGNDAPNAKDDKPKSASEKPATKSNETKPKTTIEAKPKSKNDSEDDKSSGSNKKPGKVSIKPKTTP